MSSFVHDIRVAIRGFRRTTGFAAAAILTLALGIGLSTAVFTVANAVLLRRLPVVDQDRIIVLWGKKSDGTFDNHPIGLDDAREFARRTGSLDPVSSFAYEGAWPVAIREGGRISRLRRALVSGGYFQTLGVRPALGRALIASDDVRGAAPVAVLSYAAWQQRFGGDPRILGRRIELHADGTTYTVVGVMPQGLEYPRGTELWAPIIPSTRPEVLQFVAVNIIARLGPGATPAAARREMTAFFSRADAPVWQRDLSGVVNELPRLVLGDTRPAVIVFAAACGLLLLITCINVANLLLVRGLARVREIAVRSALGAGRARVVRQLLTENALLAIAGGALGVLVAAATVDAFVAFAPPEVPRLDEIRLNAPALVGALGITGLAMLLFSVAPAVMTSRAQTQEVLRSGARHSGSRQSRLVAQALVTGQIAIALVVLSAAGLIARSLMKLERAELSFNPSQLLIAELAVRSDRFNNAASQRAVLERIVSALESVPTVHAVSPVVAIPFAGAGGWDGRLTVEGQSREAAAATPMLNMEVVAPNYFATLGMPVLRGRGFTAADREGAPRVIVVSQSTARHFWPNEDPVGKQAMFAGQPGEQFTVVGVVPDTRYRELRRARPSIYFPLRQSFFPFAPMNLAIRTVVPPAQLVGTLRSVVADVDPGVAVASAAPFERYLDRPLAQPRLNAFLLAVFAGAAVALAGIGLFGVLATMVRQRTRELGLRMALGATTSDVSRLVLRQGMVLAASGTALGLMGAIAANRLLSALLFDVSPTDAATLAGVSVVLVAVAMLAALVPARASGRIEPIVALRADG